MHVFLLTSAKSKGITVCSRRIEDRESMDELHQLCEAIVGVDRVGACKARVLMNSSAVVIARVLYLNHYQLMSYSSAPLN